MSLNHQTRMRMRDYYNKAELLTRNPRWTDCSVLSFISFVIIVIVTVV